MATRVLVTGAGGFIGHHPVKHPLEKVVIGRHDFPKPQGVRGEVTSGCRKRVGP